MPRLQTEYKHDLGQDLAVERLQATCRWAHGFTDLAETWEGNRLRFTTSVQGVRITGTIEVLPDRLLFDGKLPLLALPFRGWLPNILKNALKERPAAPLASSAHEPLLLYLHIPKAGGTSLGEFIYHHCRTEEDSDEGLVRNGVYFTADGFFRNDDSGRTADRVLLRPDLRAAMGHFAFGVHTGLQRPFRYLTMLRQPVQRVFSLYRYLKLDGVMPVADFVRSGRYREVDNDQVRRIAGVNPPVGGCTAAHLAQAQENIETWFAAVGVMERFDESLALLRLAMGWEKDVPLVARNVNTEAAAPLQADAVRAIEEANRFDLALYAWVNEQMDRLSAEQGAAFGQMLNRQRAANNVL